MGLASDLDAREQGSRLLEQHEDLRKQLLELRRVTSLQLEADSPRAWETILQQKQHLLDQLEAVDTEALFLHTQRVMNNLPRDLNGEWAERLSSRQEENVALMEEVVRIEADAAARLNSQIREVRLALAKTQRNAQVSGAYRGRSAATPRFLDSKR